MASSSSTLKLQVPKRRHFELIGKGGATIKQLQTDFNVKIDIPGRDDPKNEIIIVGKQEDLERIRKEIDSLLGIRTSSDPLVVAHLDIPTSQHGTLIGKGGSNLRELEKKFGVSIKIPRREAGETIVTLEGADKDLQAAIGEVEVILGTKVNVVASPSSSSASSSTSSPPARSPQQSAKQSPKEKGSPKPNNAAAQKQQPSPSIAKALPSMAASSPWEKKNIGGPSASPSAPAAGHEPASSDAPVSKENKGNKGDAPINKVIFFPDKDPAHHPNINQFLSYISSATSTLEICVFTITDDRISEAIINDHKKGVKVRVITDNDTSIAEGSDIQKFRDSGIEVKMDTTPFHMHHKFAVIDKKLLLNGSFNWTRGASLNNCENVMVTNNHEFVAQFSTHFESMWADHANFK